MQYYHSIASVLTSDSYPSCGLEKIEQEAANIAASLTPGSCSQSGANGKYYLSILTKCHKIEPNPTSPGAPGHKCDVGEEENRKARIY